jgi:hypothetical protein
VVVVELEALGLRSYKILLSDLDLYIRFIVFRIMLITIETKLLDFDPEIRSKASHRQITDAETFATCQQHLLLLLSLWSAIAYEPGAQIAGCDF